MRRSLILVTIVTIVLLSGACGFNPFSKNKGSKNSIEYFVHGDPRQLILGSTQNKGSFLRPEDIERFNGFHSANAVAFIERQEKEKPRPFSEVEKENTTEAKDDEIESFFELVPYSFVKVDEERYLYQAGQDIERHYVLGFTLQEGLLNLTDVDGFPIALEHYSLKDDGRAMSFLVSFEHSLVGKILLSLSFADSSEVNPLTRSPDGFQYLIDTVQVKWSSPMGLKACGSFSETESATLRASVENWSNDPKRTGESPLIPVDFAFSSDYPPFSDMNVQCIQLIRNFRLENSDMYYTAGVTLPTINSAAKYFLDSDIFLFYDNVPVSDEFDGTASSVLMHEIGHYFGLGHEFRRDALGRPLNPSIMGYSGATPFITDWDFAAIQALYGGFLTSESTP